MTVRVEHLGLEIAGRTILADASFVVGQGEVAGIVGANGAGKSTLLRVLAGVGEGRRGGTIAMTGRVGYLPQDTPRAGDGTASGTEYILAARGLDEADRVVQKARAAMEENPDDANIAAYVRAEEAYGDAGGYRAEADIAQLVASLGLDPVRLNSPLSELSGGERRRVELAKLLYGEYDVLLLDEPTNHLDGPARTWLMGYLAEHPGTMLVISHDLELLDTSIRRVLHLHDGSVTTYRGTYTKYLEASAAEQERQARAAAHQAKEIARLEEQADKMRGSTARRARIAQGLDTRVERLREQAIDAPQRQRALRIRLPQPEPPNRIVLEAVGLAKHYGDAVALDEVDLVIERGDRMVIMGPNGAGKTTLLRILAEEIESTDGAFEWGDRVRVGYFDQEHALITPGRTVLDHFDGTRLASIQDRRAIIGSLGLGGAVDQDAATLSGGEKTKLSLGLLMAGGYNVVLLDEPTNHLDPAARVAVAEMLASWEGTFLLVTHDPEFVKAVNANRVLLLPERIVDHWRPTYVEYAATLDRLAQTQGPAPGLYRA